MRLQIKSKILSVIASTKRLVFEEFQYLFLNKLRKKCENF